jgi:hypothetical protein
VSKLLTIVPYDVKESTARANSLDPAFYLLGLKPIQSTRDGEHNIKRYNV